MFDAWKRKLEEKKATEKAVAESRYWKTHPHLRSCLQAMRGSCTVAPVQMHEAAIAAVNIALAEDNWKPAEQLPYNFMEGTVYLVWNDEKLPVLTASWTLVCEELSAVKAVAQKTFLVSEYLDRIIAFDEDGTILLYSIA